MDAMRKLVLAGLVVLVCACGSNGTDDDASTDACTDPTTEPVCEMAYPAGPYGTGEGDVIENHVMTTADCTLLEMQHLYCDDSTELLLVYATAGWCTACQVESADLPGLYTDYHDQGLEILAMVFENTDSEPATVEYADGYRGHYEFTFPTVADSDRIVAGYFDPTTAPLNMFVNLRTMEILQIGTGYDAGQLRSDIETHLAAIE